MRFKSLIGDSTFIAKLAFSQLEHHIATKLVVMRPKKRLRGGSGYCSVKDYYIKDKMRY